MYIWSQVGIGNIIIPVIANTEGMKLNEPKLKALRLIICFSTIIDHTNRIMSISWEARLLESIDL